MVNTFEGLLALLVENNVVFAVVGGVYSSGKDSRPSSDWKILPMRKALFVFKKISISIFLCECEAGNMPTFKV